MDIDILNEQGNEILACSKKVKPPPSSIKRYFSDGRGKKGIPSFYQPKFQSYAKSVNQFRTWEKSDEDRLVSVVQAANLNESQPIDWIDIAKQCNFPNRDPVELMTAYRHKLNPSLNKKAWTKEEEYTLMLLAAKYEEHNWDLISEELATGRAPWQCLVHYQRSLNRKIVKETDWTQEEDKVLLKEAHRLDSTGRTHWPEVIEQLPGREWRQCVARLRSLRLKNTGKWSDTEERQLFLAAISFGLLEEDTLRLESFDDSSRHDSSSRQQPPAPTAKVTGRAKAGSRAMRSGTVYEKDSAPRAQRAYTMLKHSGTTSGHFWEQLATLVPTRNHQQCREKWINTLDPSLKSTPFTPEEDTKLRQLVVELGIGKWSTIAARVPGRTDAAILKRWKVIGRKDEVEQHLVKSNKRRKVAVPAFGREMAPSHVTEEDFDVVLTSQI
jgi:hypothetical protein